MEETPVRPQRKIASIQEQLKHIRTANDDWYDEHQRLIRELASVSQRATPDRSPAMTPQPERSSSSSDDNQAGEGASR